MCGRFTLTADVEELSVLFGAKSFPEELYPSYNIAPQSKIAVLTENAADGEREIGLFEWGLVPSWAKDGAIGRKTINARSETAHEKPSFRSAFKKRRCLIPADGFYEWMRTPEGKRPHYIKMRSGEPFAFAGLWESWKTDESEKLTCIILTTEANALMREIHHRMPVILPEENYEAWLDPGFGDTEVLREMLRSRPWDGMEAHEVSRLVNNPANDAPECVEPVRSD